MLVEADLLDVLGKAIGDPAHWCRVEEGHWRPEDTCEGAVQHHFTCLRAKRGQCNGEDEHERRLHHTEAGVATDVSTSTETVFWEQSLANSSAKSMRNDILPLVHQDSHKLVMILVP